MFLSVLWEFCTMYFYNLYSLPQITQNGGCLPSHQLSVLIFKSSSSPICAVTYSWVFAHPLVLSLLKRGYTLTENLFFLSLQLLIANISKTRERTLCLHLFLHAPFFWIGCLKYFTSAVRNM